MPKSEIKKQRFIKFVNHRENVKRILVIRNGLLGDVVFTTSMLNRLVTNFPKAEIDVIVGKSAVPILQNFPSVRNIIPFNYDFTFLSILKQINFFRKLASNIYDLAIVQEVNPHYTYMVKFARPKFIVSFSGSASFLCSYTIGRPKTKAVLAELETVKEWTNKITQDRSYLFVSDSEINDVRDILLRHGVNENESIIVFNPTSSTQNSEKDWVNERYAELGDSLIERFNVRIVFNGLPRDWEELKKIDDMMVHNPIILAGKYTLSIRHLMALIKISKLVIGVDTGPIHIAAALNIPVIMLMGFTDPADTGAYNPESMVKILTSDLPCIPCIHSNPKPKQWDICKSKRPVVCMENISAADVLKSVEELNDAKSILN